MKSRMPRIVSLSVLAGLGAGPVSADFTNNIMITGYWPNTNEMIRHFSTNPEQNPAGWQGENWLGLGYDIYSFFPEFPGGVGVNPKGEGDFEVDYQDTSSDWWRITSEIDPVAIITFSRGRPDRSWEVEFRQRNLETWIDDYEAPFQPTPAPPDPTVPPGHIRESTLPMQDIVDRVSDEVPELDAFIDERGFGGAFLSEYIAYHGVWYQDMHADPSDDAWSVAAGHIHVGVGVTIDQGRRATEASLRALIDHVNTIVPAPGGLSLLALAMATVGARRRPYGCSMT